MAGAAVKKAVMELGGADAFIVLADAVLDDCCSAADTARMRVCGQACIAAKRFIVEAPLYDAFTRRLHFIVDFPFPDPADRLRIWQTLFPPDLPRAGELDFAPLAERYKLAGGNIRNVIVSAAYLAAANGGAVTMGYLLHGVRRELQKMGRLIGEGELRIG